MILLLSLQELAVYDCGLEEGWIEGSPFVLNRPARLTREFRTNTAQHRIERLQLQAREHLGKAAEGLEHSDRAALVADASGGLVYGPTLLTVGWVGCMMMFVFSTSRMWPADEKLGQCSALLDGYGFMGFGADICTFEKATGWAIVAGQIFARVCLYLAVRVDEVKALCNRAGSLYCLAVVEDIDDTLLAAQKAEGTAAGTSARFTIRELMRLKRDTHFSKEAIEELGSAAVALLVLLASSTVWFWHRAPVTTGGTCAAVALQGASGGTALLVTMALNELGSTLSSLPKLVVEDFPPSSNKDALVRFYMETKIPR